MRPEQLELIEQKKQKSKLQKQNEQEKLKSAVELAKAKAMQEGEMEEERVETKLKWAKEFTEVDVRGSEQMSPKPSPETKAAPVLNLTREAKKQDAKPDKLTDLKAKVERKLDDYEESKSAIIKKYQSGQFSLPNKKGVFRKLGLELAKQLKMKAQEISEAN
jgi:hypothetical protein